MVEKGDDELAYRKGNAQAGLKATLAAMKAAAEA